MAPEAIETASDDNLNPGTGAFSLSEHLQKIIGFRVKHAADLFDYSSI